MILGPEAEALRERNYHLDLGKEAATKASLLQEAKKQMQALLEGEWNWPLARTKYADVVRYHGEIMPDSCRYLCLLTDMLAKKARENKDKAAGQYFSDMSQSWLAIHMLLETEPTRIANS
jgi:hypothetical protein